MRKYSVITATISALLLALISTPAHGNGVTTEGCGGGGTFTITSGVVSEGSSCAGAAVIPDGVTSIGAGAFFGATSLTSITIPASVTSIGPTAFFGATSLTSITIPASVTSIGDGAFHNTTSLTTFTVENGNPNYSSLGGVLFNHGETSLVKYPARNLQSSYSIPASVTSIGESAFASATSLTSITIPASVTSIGEGAFDSATALTSITFAGTSTLASIGDGAFARATSLTSITIPAGVTSIGDGAFNEATSLTSITISASVTSIGDYAFYDATSLASVYFLGNAPTAATGAFVNVAAGAKAYIKTGATGFAAIDGVWNNLTVAIGVYNVTYDSSGGSVVAPGAFIKDGAISQASTQPTKSGYTFTGWSATDGGSVLTFPYTPTSNGDLTLYATWSVRAVATTTPTATTPPVDLVAQAAAADLAARTVKAKSKFAGKALASRVGVITVSSKAKITFSVSKASKKICAKSGSKLKTLKAGNCVVTFTVQEPKPKKGKKPKATKTVKTLIVQ